ncbi:hypothetical protein [Tessaracoccus aquimaris]|uniref:hypothetical protein n=1 Tax=Tessaracoccus aquimaris TaxID=1332264 RepID=UPI0011AB5686|nr:hypothetical protein [Tessaracoccus aquimaris]
MTQPVRPPAAVSEALPSALGAVGLALGVVSALGMLFGVTMVASLAAQAAEGAMGFDPPLGLSIWMPLVSIAEVLGNVAMAVSIVAIVLDRGRRMAIGGLILAIIAVLFQANAVFATF